MPEKRRVLFLVTGDPRSSGKIVEAIRMAVGLRAWNALSVTVYLGGEAVAALNEFPEELVDGVMLRDLLPDLIGQNGIVLVPRGTSMPAAGTIREVDYVELARLAASHDHVMRIA